MKYSNVYCLKLVIVIALKISLRAVNLMSFDLNRKNKIMSILGRVVPRQRKNRALLKKHYRWLCVASGYQIIWNTLVKHGFIQKKKKITIFLGAYLGGYSIIISLYVGASKKNMQQNSSIELTFISR